MKKEAPGADNEAAAQVPSAAHSSGSAALSCTPAPGKGAVEVEEHGQASAKSNRVDRRRRRSNRSSEGELERRRSAFRQSDGGIHSQGSAMSLEDRSGAEDNSFLKDAADSLPLSVTEQGATTQAQAPSIIVGKTNPLHSSTSSAQVNGTLETDTRAEEMDNRGTSDGPPGPWITGAGEDTSSLTGNISDDGYTFDEGENVVQPPLTWNYAQSPHEHGFERQLQEQNKAYASAGGGEMADPNFYGMGAMSGEPTYQDLPVAEIRYNEQTNNMDVTTETIVPPPPPEYKPSIIAPAPWEEFIDMKATGNASQYCVPPQAPDLPVLRTPARLLHEADNIFDFKNERLLEISFAEPAAGANGDNDTPTISSSSKVTLDDMMAILPHPQAFFSPSMMEWIVVAEGRHFLRSVPEANVPRMTRKLSAPLEQLQKAVGVKVHESYALEFISHLQAHFGESSNEYADVMEILRLRNTGEITDVSFPQMQVLRRR